MPRWLAGLGAVALCSFGAPGAEAEWRPSSELAFTAEVKPDSVTVGDPIQVVLRGSAPDSGMVIQPSWSDTLGPFQVLTASNESEERADGRVSFRRELTVTAFRTGDLKFPDLPLLWVAGGDTAVARAPEHVVHVQSLLSDSLDLSDPTAAMAELRDLKDVVGLGQRDWVKWAAVAAAVLLLAALAAFLWRRRRRPETAAPVAAPAKPRLKPEEAFEAGLAQLFEAKLLEKGEVKAYYAGVSMLLREYLEGRFALHAVEETREEILEHAKQSVRMNDEDRVWLGEWLLDADLVKFAKMERLLAEGREFAESARRWVRETSRRTIPVETRRGIPVGASVGSADVPGSRSASSSQSGPVGGTSPTSEFRSPTGDGAPPVSTSDSVSSAASRALPLGAPSSEPSASDSQETADASASNGSLAVGGLGSLTPVTPPVRLRDRGPASSQVEAPEDAVEDGGDAPTRNRTAGGDRTSGQGDSSNGHGPGLEKRDRGDDAS